MCAARRGRVASLAAPVLALVTLAGPAPALGDAAPVAVMPGYAPEALSLGRDLDGDGDPDEIAIELEVIEVEQEVYPGEVLTFWVFAPAGRGMVPVARAPSPTIRVEQGDHVRVTLRNTHYFPHTIHFHGTIHPNAMDGVPDFTQAPVVPGEAFVYEFVAANPGTHFY
ncbi:MAG: multicopper oxidase domain-containing protein, partial [Paracoccaceae bacterium]